MSYIHIPHIKPDENIEQIISALLSTICKCQVCQTVPELVSDSHNNNELFTSLLHAFAKTTIPEINCDKFEKAKDSVSFQLDNESVSEAISKIETSLFRHPEIHSLRNPISYLLGELICNIQQHSQAETGMVFTSFNEFTNTVDVFIADNGISIYGSYINAQKYMDKFSNPAEALDLASKGFSTKNLPNAENRGYGISSNAKMIVNGLYGTFSIISNNAFYHFSTTREITLSLPEDITWNGSIIIARIPVAVPNTFDFYKYISL